jgi:hypothetical protein
MDVNGREWTWINLDGHADRWGCARARPQEPFEADRTFGPNETFADAPERIVPIGAQTPTFDLRCRNWIYSDRSRFPRSLMECKQESVPMPGPISAASRSKPGMNPKAGD